MVAVGPAFDMRGGRKQAKHAAEVPSMEGLGHRVHGNVMGSLCGR